MTPYCSRTGSLIDEAIIVKGSSQPQGGAEVDPSPPASIVPQARRILPGVVEESS